MTRKNVTEIKGDEILERPVISSDYQIILAAGTVIKQEYIERLLDIGVTYVFVKEDKVLLQEIAILKEDVEQKIKEKVKEILEHHIYRYNDKLIELSQEVNSIISSILDEQEVLEQVYDIKERNADVYEHSLSICSMAVVTAYKLGLIKEMIHDIGVGCLLHDLGLRYLTLDYENKDISDLSPADIMEYKKHPIYGYTTLQEENWLSEISKNIILSHHERIDGSGYPLRTTAIPLEVSIVSVCDVFDEMICGIGCKKTKVNEAVEYLKTFKNVKFDGKVVDEFLKFTAVYPVGTKVMTNEGETGIVIRQNKEFPDRPILEIIKDQSGKKMETEVTKNLLKIQNVFIEKVLD